MKISASQIALSRQCLRKWAFAYIAGHREPSTPQQEQGTRVHKILEDHVGTGVPIDARTDDGRIAQAAIPWLPPVLTGSVEGNFEIPKEGFSFSGFFDWTGQGFLGPGPGVLDYKTTSSFDWAKTPEELAKDPQALLYSQVVLGDAKEVFLRWLYLRTKDAAVAKPVDFSLARVHILAGIDDLTAEAETLVQLRTIKVNPLDLPPTPSACFSYQRLCPHAHKCQLTVGERLSKMQPIGKEALLAQLLDKAKGATPPTQASTSLPPIAVAPAAPPVAAAAPAPADNAAAIQALQAQLAALTAPVAPSPAPVAGPVALPPSPPVSSLPPMVTPAETPKRPPGRPKKEAAAPVPAAAPAVPSAALDYPISVLYVNCIPVGCDVLRVNSLYAQAHHEIAESSDGLHYKHIEYGKGPALFAICVAEAAKRAPGEYYVDSRTPEGSDTLETLMSLSQKIVRAV